MFVVLRYVRAGPGQRQHPHRPAWTYARHDRPFAGPYPPAAMFFYSRDRGGEHPSSIWQAMPDRCRPTPTPVSVYEKMPGSYPYRYGASVLSAIALAGGVAGWSKCKAPISDFLFADERLRILESTRRALIIRRARLEAQRDGARTFEALLTVSTPLGVPQTDLRARDRCASSRAACLRRSFSARAEGGCKHPKTCRTCAGGYEGSSGARGAYKGF